MQEFQYIVQILEALGIKSFLAPFLGFLLVLWLAKNTLFKGSAFWIKSLFESWLIEQRRRIEIEIKLENSVTDLVNKFDEIAEGMWSIRQYYDERMDRMESILGRVEETSKSILFFAKKRQADWVRDTEQQNY